MRRRDRSPGPTGEPMEATQSSEYERGFTDGREWTRAIVHEYQTRIAEVYCSMATDARERLEGWRPYVEACGNDPEKMRRLVDIVIRTEVQIARMMQRYALDECHPEYIPQS